MVFHWHLVETSKMLEQILELVYPSNIYCIACGNLIDKTRPYSLCDKCIKEIHWISKNTCSICGKSLYPSTDASEVCYECKGVQHSFDKGYSCAVYEGPVKEILSGFKYKGKSYMGNIIGDMMLDRAQGFIQDIDFQTVIPIPMHKSKKKSRGFNQSEILAKKIAFGLGKEYRNDILFKQRNTPPMSSLDSTERRINLHGAFQIGYNKDEAIKDKDIMLVDDVYTTGSTLDECATLLKKSGTDKVFIYTFASGVNMMRRTN